MKILLTGANGYIGKRLLQTLAEKGHHIVAMVRSLNRLDIPKHLEKNVTTIRGNLLKPESLREIPNNIEAAYYLVHSMGNLSKGFSDLEKECAENFSKVINKTQAKQIIYLSGLSLKDASSEHMHSRHPIEIPIL